ATDSVTTPSVVMEAILFTPNSVKSRLFLFPGRMFDAGLGIEKVVVASVVGFTRVTWGKKALVIQRLPSGPAAIEPGELRPVNSVITPSGVTRAYLSTACSVTQTLPSAPSVISPGK